MLILAVLVEIVLIVRIVINLVIFTTVSTLLENLSRPLYSRGAYIWGGLYSGFYGIFETIWKNFSHRRVSPGQMNKNLLSQDFSGKNSFSKNSRTYGEPVSYNVVPYHCTKNRKSLVVIDLQS